MKTLTHQRGQSLLEILFAITIFTIGVVTLGYLIFDAYVSTRAGLESLQARLLAEEGIAAVLSIADVSFLSLTEGIYGLEVSNNHWALLESPDVVGKFTRTITITTVDDEVKKVSSQITWNITDVREGNITFVSYVSDWGKQSGDGSNLNVDATTAFLSASGTTLSGITLFNLGDADILLTSMKLQWEGTPQLYAISLDTNELFAVEPSLGVVSSTVVDVTDAVISHTGGVTTLGPIQFSESVADTNLLISLIFSDGTRRHIHIDH